MSTKKSRGATQAASAPTNVATDAAIEVLTVTTGVQQADNQINQINNNLEPVKEEIQQLDPFAAAAAEQAQIQASNEVQNTVNQAQNTVNQTSNQVQNTVNQTSNQAQNTINQTTNQAQSTVNQATNQAQNTVNQAKNTVTQTSNQAQNTVNQAQNTVNQVTQSIKDKPKAQIRPVRPTNQNTNNVQNEVVNAVNTYNNDGYKNTVAEQKKGVRSYGNRDVNRQYDDNNNGQMRHNAAELCLCCIIF